MRLVWQGSLRRLWSLLTIGSKVGIALNLMSLCFVFVPQASGADAKVPTSQRSLRAIAQNKPLIVKELEKSNLTEGSPIFIRIFKQEAELELWIENKTGQFQLFKTYPICTFSGRLGPKTRVGDLQSPEGFYFVTPSQMNPWSQYHLSFNLGYPNAYDRAWQRTGSALMVHGKCVSIGCFAMTDAGIEQIYTLANMALEHGQAFFRVHIFPFRMDEQHMSQHQKDIWGDFWLNLKEGYDWFESRKTPPNVRVTNKRYIFSE